MALFKILKGLKSNLEAQPKKEGYAWYTTDDSKLYIDVSNSERQPLNSYYADKLKGNEDSASEVPDLSAEDVIDLVESAKTYTDNQLTLCADILAQI